MFVCRLVLWRPIYLCLVWSVERHCAHLIETWLLFRAICVRLDRTQDHSGERDHSAMKTGTKLKLANWWLDNKQWLNHPLKRDHHWRVISEGVQSGYKLMTCNVSNLWTINIQHRAFWVENLTTVCFFDYELQIQSVFLSKQLTFWLLSLWLLLLHPKRWILQRWPLQ